MPKHEADRIKQARSSTLSEGISSGRVIPWSRGRSGDNDDRVARRNQRISDSRKARAAEGRSQGLSEADIANKAGVEKIWGCQNLIYALEIS
jgi:hypothetical protein